jgi:Zc3h12a-like Ribonuclease NYN domain
MRRRQQPKPPPPPIHSIVIDGANVIASGSSRAVERIDLALTWLRSWQPTLPIQIFLDATTFARCRPDAQAWLQSSRTDSANPTQVTLCPPGTEADIPLLEHARTHHGLVLSNDRFFDHADLRAEVMTLQFTLDRLDFCPATEVTWFRTKGPAVRVPIHNLVVQRLGRP